MQIAVTEAVACRCRAYSETSQTVTFFTRSFGMISGLAKGIQRPRNDFGGPFDALVGYEITFLRKNAPALHTITGAELLEPYRTLRLELDRYLCAAFLLELVLETAPQDEPAVELYELFTASLRMLNEGGNIHPILIGFVLKALAASGTALRLTECAHCGAAAPGSGTLAFSPSDGGILCGRCGTSASVRASAMKIRAGSLRMLNALALSRTEGLAKISLPEGERKELLKIVRRALRFLLEKPPVMLEYIN